MLLRGGVAILGLFGAYLLLFLSDCKLYARVLDISLVVEIAVNNLRSLVMEKKRNMSEQRIKKEKVYYYHRGSSNAHANGLLWHTSSPTYSTCPIVVIYLYLANLLLEVSRTLV